MAIRPLVILPDPRLKEVSRPVESVTPELRTLVEDMFETMYDAPGIGLAAVQIGAMIRLVVVDIGKPDPDAPEDAEDEPPAEPLDHGEADGEAGTEDAPKAKRKREPDPMVLINPEIVWASEARRVHEEGCLSIPDYYEDVERPDRIRVRFRDLDWKEREIEADGLLATCIQHEIDHLNGVLFIDHLSKLKRDRCVKKFTKAARK